MEWYGTLTVVRWPPKFRGDVHGTLTTLVKVLYMMLTVVRWLAK